MNPIQIKPIGIVRSSFTPDVGDKWNTTAKIILHKEYTLALKGIEEYSHVIILFWMHQISDIERQILQIRPRGLQDLPVVGIFATRSEARPNPIGLTVADLVSKEENILRVRGLDAFDGTLVLDIKPYDHYDVKQSLRVPEWWLKMTRRRCKRHINP